MRFFFRFSFEIEFSPILFFLFCVIHREVTDMPTTSPTHSHRHHHGEVINEFDFVFFIFFMI